jgi:hypothetical protein
MKLILLRLAPIAILIALQPFFNNSTYAINNDVLFSDNFNAGSFEKWNSTRLTSSQWSIKNGKANALILTPFTTVEMIPKDSLWNSEWANFEYSLDVKPIKGVDKNVVFTFTNPNDWIDIHFFNNEFEVAHFQNGINSFAKRGYFSMINGQTYGVRVSKQNGKLNIHIDNVLIFEHQFPLGMLDGKISIKATTGASYPTEIEFDNVVVRAIAPEESFPHFKQDDPTWAKEEYNHATKWSSSGTGIEDYGCALTSAAMILHAHDITTLPDDQEIDPSTLNAWLRTQKDGYVGSGLLNFAAITRLTRELHELRGTTKLEYGRENIEPAAVAGQEINDDRPVVLQISGHFLVGYDQENGDFLIKDPAYDYTHFSEHATQLVSTRTFTPSNTDLSYIIITHDPTLSLQLTNHLGEVVATSRLEHLSSPLTGSSSPTTAILEFAKPETGTYSISIQGEIFSDYSLDLYTYDLLGMVTQTTQSGTLGGVMTTYTLEYSKQAPSTTFQSYSWQDFASEVDHLFSAQHITKFYITQALTKYRSFAENLDLAEQKSLIQHKKRLVKWFVRGISPESKAVLLERLQLLEEDL